MMTKTTATCTNCGQTLKGAPEPFNKPELKVENCICCGYSNYVADDRPVEYEIGQPSWRRDL